MWNNPFGRSEGARERAFSTEGRLVYAIGDVHGRADLLERMFDAIENEADEDKSGPPLVVFIGDYIDRGPDSRAVLDLLLSGRPYGCERRLLMGNHEQMLRDALRDPQLAPRWFAFGGLNTLVSYRLRPPPITAQPQELNEAMRRLEDAMGDAHLRLLAALEQVVPLGDYLFVHAGIHPAKPLSAQTERDLFWIREPFLSHRKRMPLRVVHGHTPVAAPTQSAPRIAIDTGAHASGVLTAARIRDDAVSFVSATA